MRAFIAIDLPDDTAAALAELQQRLPAGRPVPRDNLHLTLAFLDDQPEAVLEDLHFELASLRALPFDLRLSGLGCFGGRVPKVLFAGLDPSAELTRLHGQVVNAVRSAGIARPRERFRPHVTLARFNRPPDRQQAGRLQDFLAAHDRLTLPPFPVNGFCLYRSTLHSEGAIHEELARYPLAPA